MNTQKIDEISSYWEAKPGNHSTEQSFFFGGGHTVECSILVPWSGIEPVTPAMEGCSSNLCTTREVPFDKLSVCFCDDLGWYPLEGFLLIISLERHPDFWQLKHEAEF